jgi:hypothetical protein
MFWGASAFNQDLSDWNVCRGTNFIAMFRGAEAFSHALSWDLSCADDEPATCSNRGMFGGSPGSISESDVKECIDDACPNDPAKTSRGICGCGNPETGDADGDGTADCIDECPDDPEKTEEGKCLCRHLDPPNDGECNSPAPVDLGSAGNYVILAKSGISTVPASIITGDIAVSPIAATAITGFGLTLESGGQYSTASQITGSAFAASYGGDIATALTTAVGDMGTAYTDAASRASTAPINLANGAIGGLTLTPGVYTFNMGISIGSDVTFHGSSESVFIMQTTGVLTLAADKKVILTGGVLAKNIFWQVADYVEVLAGAHMEGILLAKTKVDFITESSLNGRVLAQTAVTLQKATITAPA